MDACGPPKWFELLLAESIRERWRISSMSPGVTAVLELAWWGVSGWRRCCWWAAVGEGDVGR